MVAIPKPQETTHDSRAQVYHTNDYREYKGYDLRRHKDGPGDALISISKDGEPVAGLESKFTKYSIAEAAIDKFLEGQPITDEPKRPIPATLP